MDNKKSDLEKFKENVEQYNQGNLPDVRDSAEIADALNERGVRSASGGKWQRSAVRNLLTRAPLP